MEQDLREVVISELKADEQLLWQGTCTSRMGQQNKAGLLSSALVLTIAGILLGSFLSALFLGTGVPALSVVTIPLLLLFLPRMLNSSAYRKKRTAYAVTDRRVLVIRDLFRNRQIRMIPIENVANIQLLSFGTHQQRGTLKFRAGTNRPDQYLRQSPGRTDLTFFMIRSPEQVRDLVLTVQKPLRSGEETRPHDGEQP